MHLFAKISFWSEFLISYYSIVTRLPLATQQLFALLLGTWFRVVNHSEYNTMSSDAVAKNVASYLFHSVAGDLDRVQRAVHLLQILIDDFSVPNMLGSRNVQYFADMSRARVYSDGKRCSVRSIYSTFCEFCPHGSVTIFVIFSCSWLFGMPFY